MSTKEVALGSRTTPLAWIDLDAIRDVTPILIGLAPFAMVIGIAMSAAGYDIASGVLGSFLMWSGAAHLAAIEMIKTSSGIVSILATVAVINARFVMYGAALEPRFRSQPRLFRWLAPHLLIDQNFVLASARPELADPQRFRRYWLTVSAAIGVVWLSVIGLTLAFGAALPPDSPFGFASTTVLLGLLVPKLRENKARLSVVIAIVATIVGASIFGPLGLLFGALAGALIPSFLERSEA